MKRYNCSLPFLLLSNCSFQVINGGYSAFKFNFAYTIWWWQLGCKEAWTLLSMMKLFWLIKVRSMHEDKLGKICVGSQVSWLKP